MRFFQARTLEWVAISSSEGSSPPRDRTQVSRISCTGRRAVYLGSTNPRILRTKLKSYTLPANLLVILEATKYVSDIQTIDRAEMFAGGQMQTNSLEKESKIRLSCSLSG